MSQCLLSNCLVFTGISSATVGVASLTSHCIACVFEGSHAKIASRCAAYGHSRVKIAVGVDGCMWNREMATSCYIPAVCCRVIVEHARGSSSGYSSRHSDRGGGGFSSSRWASTSFIDLF